MSSIIAYFILSLIAFAGYTLEEDLRETNERDLKQITCLFGGPPGNQGNVPVDDPGDGSGGVYSMENKKIAIYNASISYISGINTTFSPTDADKTLPDAIDPIGKSFQELFINFCFKCNISVNECVCTKQTIICNFVKELTGETTSINYNRIVLDCITEKNLIYVKASLRIIFGTFGFVGNLLVILITRRYREKLSRCHYLIGCLATADCFFALFLIIQSVPMFWTCEWLYGLFLCKISYAAVDLSGYLAMGFILLITLERYFGIVHPLTRIISKKLFIGLIVGNVVCGVAAISPTFYFTNIHLFEKEKKKCVDGFPLKFSFVYSWISFIVYFCVPVTGISFMYVKIIYKLRESVAATLNIFGDRHQQKRREENSRIMKLLVSIIASAIILILPIRLIWIIQDHIGESRFSNTDFNVISMIGFIPYTIHVSINPIIYSIIDKTFRKRIISIFRRRVGENETFEMSGASSFQTSISNLK